MHCLLGTDLHSSLQKKHFENIIEKIQTRIIPLENVIRTYDFKPPFLPLMKIFFINMWLNAKEIFFDFKFLVAPSFILKFYFLFGSPWFTDVLLVALNI